MLLGATKHSDHTVLETVSLFLVFWENGSRIMRRERWGGVRETLCYRYAACSDSANKRSLLCSTKTPIDPSAERRSRLPEVCCKKLNILVYLFQPSRGSQRASLSAQTRWTVLTKTSRRVVLKMTQLKVSEWTFVCLPLGPEYQAGIAVWR